MLSLSGEARYKDWIQRYEVPLSLEDSTETGHLTDQPLMSVIMPVFNPPLHFLAEAIESVLSQSYPHLELCIADDASTDPEVRLLLERYQATDPRVKVCFRAENGHISEASNSALSLAQGDYVVLFDHDDLLAESALWRVAEAINQRPGVRLLYSDEDKITPEGVRHEPYFKPDWNIDLFHAQNLFSHLGVIERRLIHEVGGFRKGYEGSQDYDLVLRCVEKVSLDAICHIPRVLYHWRVHPESTASGSAAKPYAVSAAERALNTHFERMAVGAEAEAVEAGYRVRYRSPAPSPRVNIVFTGSLTAPSIRKLMPVFFERTHGTEVFVNVSAVTDCSDNAALIALRNIAKSQSRLLIHEDLKGASNVTNISRRALHSEGEILIFLSPGLVPESDQWVRELVSILLQPGVGCVGGKVLNRWGLIHEAGVVLGMGAQGLIGYPCRGYEGNTLGYFGQAALMRSVSAVGPSCLVTRSSDFKAQGGFDVEMAMHLAVVDYSIRLNANGGKRCVYTPYAVLRDWAGRIGPESGRSRESFLQGSDVFKQRWAQLLDADPFYSPNLSLEDHRYGFACPPRMIQNGGP